MLGYNDSHINLLGGSIGGCLEAFDRCHLTVSGGSIGGKIIAGYDCDDDSVITFVGSDFAINGEHVDYGRYFRGDYPNGTLTGTLANGGHLGNYFEISGDSSIVLGPLLLLLNPNGGENLVAGQTYTVSWESWGIDINDVNIVYSTDNGSNWTHVDANAHNTGSYEWLVPTIDSNECLVRISDANDPTIGDVSDGLFTIYECTLAYDLNHDCFVNFSDFALLVSEWLECGNPYDPNCVQ